MLQLVFTLVILILLLIFFSEVARRAWRSRRAWIRWPGVFLAGLAAVLLLAVILVSALGTARLYLPKEVSRGEFPVKHTPENIARGEHLARVVCASCHSPDRTNPLPLAGGDRSLSVDVGLPLGTIIAPNITSASDIANWSDADLAVAIRQRIAPDGRPILMPALALSNLGDEDLAAVIAYLRSQPAIENPTPAVKPTLLTAALAGIGLFELSTPGAMQPITAPARGVTPEYGKYIVDYMDCRACHGEDLTGGDSPLSLGTNLTYIVPGLSEEEFVSIMRTGVNRSGRQIDPNMMPWIEIGRLDDDELSALYLYLSNLEPMAHVTE